MAVIIAMTVSFFVRTDMIFTSLYNKKYPKNISSGMVKDINKGTPHMNLRYVNYYRKIIYAMSAFSHPDFTVGIGI
jgi:hypothetical protein